MKRIFFAILILTSSQLGAQLRKQTSVNQNSTPFERVVLHTDRDFYLSGEKIWLKAYCFFNCSLPTEDLSKVLYVELYNNELNLKHKFQITKGTSSGSIQIPADYKTGNYTLRAYTHYLKNFNPENYFSKIIAIVNPNKSPSNQEVKIIDDSIKSLKSNYDDAHNLKIGLNKKSFGTRELVTLNIEPLIAEAIDDLDLSISVVKKGTVQNQNSSNPLIKNNGINLNSNIKWTPEIRDVSISGIAYHSQSRKPISNLPIYVSAFKNPPQIHIIRTNQKGEFIYSLNSLKDSRDIYIGPRSLSGESIELQINNDFSTEFADQALNQIEINSAIKLLIEEMSINHQAGRIYKTDPGNKIIETRTLPFHFNKAPFSVLLDKYVDTPTLEMVFDELVPRCSVIKRKENFHLIVDNEDEDILYQNPLVLIDNIPVFDMNHLMEIHPSKIEKISVYTEPMVLGDNLIEGLVLVTTRSDNFAGIEMPKGSIFLNYQTISTSNKFEAPRYDKKDKRESRLADFRTTLYWSPKLLIKDKEQINFYTSDHESEYEVIVKGFSMSGEFYFGKKSFFVTTK